MQSIGLPLKIASALFLAMAYASAHTTCEHLHMNGLLNHYPKDAELKNSLSDLCIYN